MSRASERKLAMLESNVPLTHQATPVDVTPSAQANKKNESHFALASGPADGESAVARRRGATGTHKNASQVSLGGETVAPSGEVEYHKKQLGGGKNAASKDSPWSGGAVDPYAGLTDASGKPLARRTGPMKGRVNSSSSSFPLGSEARAAAEREEADMARRRAAAAASARANPVAHEGGGGGGAGARRPPSGGSKSSRVHAQSSDSPFMHPDMSGPAPPVGRAPRSNVESATSRTSSDSPFARPEKQTPVRESSQRLSQSKTFVSTLSFGQQ